MASRPLLLSAAACALLAAGCSLLLSTADPSQCASTADCAANPSFRGRVCTEGFCVVAVQQESGDAGSGCTSTPICTAGNSNKASVCRVAGGPCTAWQNELCPIITGPWDSPDAIVIGSILPFHVKQDGAPAVDLPYARRVQQAIDLGVSELDGAFPQGLIFPGSGPRRVAVLHCDSQFDATQAQLAMQHLTEVVGAQAVIVGGDTELLAVQAQATAKQTALLCSDCIGPFPPGNTAWRIIPPLAQQAPMAAWRVSDLETTIMAGPTPPALLKVAVLAAPGRGEQAFVSALQGVLRFNGKSAAANGTAFLVETEEDAQVETVVVENHVDAIIALAPDVIVVAMGSDFPARYLDLLEAEWPAGMPKPRYVLTTLAYEVSPFVTTLTKTAELRSRISGTRTAYEPALESNIAGFTGRYRPTYNFHDPDGNYSGYDAFYAFTYAIAAATSQSIYDGPHIAAGIERLRGGPTIDFGPDGLRTGVPLVGAGHSINVRGLWSDLDWDLTTHDIVVDDGMFCFSIDENDSLVLKLDESVRYAQATRTVTGHYTCN